MKQMKYMIVALAGLSLLACNKEQDIVPEGEHTYTITVDANGRTAEPWIPSRTIWIATWIRARIIIG